MLVYMGASALLTGGIFTLTFFAALKRDKWALMDTAWGLGFPATALLGLAFFSEGGLWTLPAALTSIWGLRLAWHLGLRNGALAEDPRYVPIKKDYAQLPLYRAYLQVFMLQALIMWLMCLPFYLALPFDPARPAFIYAGSLVCLWGLFWEITADGQLKHYVQTQKKLQPGRGIETGLWAWSRHPNYFGEISFWAGIWICGLGAGGWQPMVFGLLSPLIIGLVIAKVTGPMLEQHMEKYENWAAYKARVPYIFPKIPRN